MSEVRPNAEMNDAIRGLIRDGDVPDDEEPVEPTTPRAAPSIDAGAGTGGSRTSMRRPSMNASIRAVIKGAAITE